MPYWQPANNQVPSVADWVSYVADQVIAQITSGTRPSGTPMQIVGETDTGRFQGFDGSGWVQFGGLTSAALIAFTPQLDQGASTNITKTMNYSQYQRWGNLVHWQFVCSVTAAGTAGSQITVTTPVTMSSANPLVGAGTILDGSATNRYSGTWIVASTTTIRLFVTVTGTGAWGQTPNLALANGDSFHGSVWLPVA